VKAFENKTNTGNEPAVKKGNSLPSDAVNIGYFSTEEITPERHLTVTDISSSIPENVSSGFAAETDTVMYADEFGVLRYVRTNAEAGQIAGSPIVHNSEVSISNKLMNFTQEQINYNFTGRENDFESNFFVHSYYVSTDYVLLSSSVTDYEGMENSSELRNPNVYNIRVVNHFGKEDETVKYKIFLEKYTDNRFLSNMPGTIYENLDLYRIIVLLEQADPQNLYLIYDKYEKDEENIPYNPFFGYKEKINSVPFYNYVSEESEVVDPSSVNKRFYSTQLFSYKENDLLTTRISNDGWKIYTPRKAIQDPRTFQSFNWRLIAKINYNFSQTRNVYSNDERPTIKVGVLYSGPVDEAKNAYVFNNMQESIFNIQNYIFTNPNAQPGLNESEKNYWLVDIDNLSNSYSNYDLLIWTPTRTITDQQATTVENILAQNISVFIDMSTSSSVYSSGLGKFGFTGFNVQNTSSGNLTIVDGTYKDGNTSMQAWSLSEYSESSTNRTYSIFGKRKDVLNNNSLIPLPTFVGAIDTDSPSTSIVNIGSNSDGTINSAVLKRSGNRRPGLFPSSLVITAIPFLQLVNDIVSAEGTQTSNNGSRNIYQVGTIGSQRTTGISEIVVGPNKFFYNIISEINKTKVNNFATQNTNDGSTVLWHVSPWRNSWTINGRVNNNQITVLSEQEKVEFNFGLKTAIGSTESKFYRQVSPSITQLLTADFEGTINGGDAQNIINQDFSNVDFYLESTNPNVSFINFDNINERVSSGQETLIGQASLNYKLFKLSTVAKNQIKDSSISLDAVSNVLSAELDISPGYPYVITNTSQYQDRTGNNIRTPSDFLPGSQDVADYSFALNTQISINEITKTVNQYRINWSTPFSSLVSGTGDFRNYTISKGGTSGSLARTDYTVAQSDENKIEIDKIYSPFNDYKYPSRIFSRTDVRSIDTDSTASSLNNFHYTGDIDENNRWDEYRINYDSGSSEFTITEVPQSVAYGPFYDKVYKGEKLTSTNLYRAFINPSFSWKVFFGQSCLIDPFWYSDIEPEEFFILPVSITRFTRKPLNLIKYVLNIIHPLNSISSLSPFVVDSVSLTSNFFNATYSTDAQKLQLAQLIMSKFKREYFFVNQQEPTKTSSYYSSSTGSSYIKYIQYTLSKQGYPVTVDGTYNRATYTQVKNFQVTKSQSFIDGIVDSETKSVLAIYWLNLYKNNITAFTDQVTNAPPGVAKYINAAVKYSDIANIGTPGKEYRRISFTGIPGPTQIVDYLICKVPQVAAGQKVHSVTIKTGGWPAEVDMISVYEQDFNIENFFANTVEGAKIPNAQYKVAWLPGDKVIAANSTRLINFDTYDGVENIKYVMIKLKSRKLAAKYGPNAEGFSIADISFSLSADGQHVPPVFGTSSRFEGLASGIITGYTDIESSEQKALDFSTILTAINSANSVQSIQLNSISFVVNNSGVSKTITHNFSNADKERRNKLDDKYSFNQAYETEGSITIEIDALSSNLSLRSPSPTISSAVILSANNSSATTDSSAFSLLQVPNRTNLYLLQTTNGVQYDSVETSPITNVTGFYIADADNISSRQNVKLTINVRDGLVVLTDEFGKPAGFPNFNSYVPTSNNSIYGFGFINLLWSDATPPPYGLDWQFVYIHPTTKQRTFLGRKVSYQEIADPSKGLNNVFIGLNAFDADSNSNTESNIVEGGSRNGQLQISNRPTRYLCPVYSVKVKNRPKISVYGPSNSLSKFDTWYVNLTQGKFIKTITVPTSYNFTNWMQEYRGKQIKSYYNTTAIKAPYSSIFGFGYYDIYEENPKIISDNEIKLRQEKVHAVQEQYDKQLPVSATSASIYTDASPIVPWIKVYVKNLNGKWIEVSKKDIRSFNKHTGTIIFKKELVPSQEKDIKVNYTVKNSSIMVHQIDGQRLNINPYNGLAIDKPIFIYALPVKCEEINNGAVSDVQGFSSDGPIAFTYDASVFNINSTKYNPFALHLATVTVNNLYDFNNVKVEDMRVKGGGIKHDVDIINEYESNKDILSFADVYSGKGFLHANGGYVIIRIPKEVINNFNSKQDVYNIVRNNLTAGVSFDIQDVDGTDWRSIIDVE
jgi:hypothetical protein